MQPTNPSLGGSEKNERYITQECYFLLFCFSQYPLPPITMHSHTYSNSPIDSHLTRPSPRAWAVVCNSPPKRTQRPRLDLHRYQSYSVIASLLGQWMGCKAGLPHLGVSPTGFSYKSSLFLSISQFISLSTSLSLAFSVYLYIFSHNLRGTDRPMKTGSDTTLETSRIGLLALSWGTNAYRDFAPPYVNPSAPSTNRGRFDNGRMIRFFFSGGIFLSIVVLWRSCWVILSRLKVVQSCVVIYSSSRDIFHFLLFVMLPGQVCRV